MANSSTMFNTSISKLDTYVMCTCRHHPGSSGIDPHDRIQAEHPQGVQEPNDEGANDDGGGRGKEQCGGLGDRDASTEKGASTAGNGAMNPMHEPSSILAKTATPRRPLHWHCMAFPAVASRATGRGRGGEEVLVAGARVSLPRSPRGGDARETRGE
jgi:hypothetical protein